MTVMDFPTAPVDGQTTTDGRYYFDASVGTSGAWRSAPLPVGGLPAGSIIQWGATTPPANWLLCDGSAVSRTTYSSLFAAIGTTYGAGNGSTTFNLPDLPNGTAAGIIGQNISTTTHVVTTTQADITGATVANVTLRAGRTYRFSFSSAQALTISGTSPRMRFDFLVNSTLIERQYVGALATTGQAFNVETYYTPASDMTATVKASAVIDLNSGTIQFYAEASTTSRNVFTVEDLGEASGSGLRQLHIIKATAGWTAGDSELATRLGAVETAQATTNRSGLVPILPTSVGAVSSGTASVGANGLVSFSGSTGVNLNGIFTSGYTNYKIIFSLGSTTTTASILMRYRTGLTDNTTSNYFMGAWAARHTGSSGDYRTGPDSKMFLGEVVGMNWGSAFIDIYQPFNAVRTTHSFQSQGYQSSAITSYTGGGLFDATTQFDGISFQVSSGTFAGTIQVYGYR